MKKHLSIIFVILIALFFRLYQLGVVPQGLTWDEAAIGYNAYSILKTGKDEFGAFLPVIFKSFGDYKPGFYIYLTVPAVAIFDLTPFAVRLPSALFGSLTIFGVYLLVQKLFNKKLLSLLSALSLALMPWHIHFSRGAWETNVFSCFLLFSIIFFINFIKDRKQSDLIITLIFALLSMATYQSGKLLTPLLLFIAWLVLDGNIKKEIATIKSFKKPYFIFPLILILVFYIATFGGEAKNRLERLSIFGYRPGISSQDIKLDGGKEIATFFHSEVRQKFEQIAGRYLYHFSPEVLAFQGVRFTERGHLPEFGLITIIDFALLIVGLYYFSRHFQKEALLILLFLLISPIPASLTLEEFSSVRSFFMTIPLSILIGSALYIIASISPLILAPVVGLNLLVLTLISDVYLNHSYKYFSWEYNDGYVKAMNFAAKYPDSKVVATDVYGQPYIYYLFATKYDPQKYQKENSFQSGGKDVGFVGRVGQTEFHQFGIQDINQSKNTIFIGTVGNIPDTSAIKNLEYFQELTDSSNQVILRIVKTY